MFKAEFKRELRENLAFYPDFISSLVMMVILLSVFMILGQHFTSSSYIGYAFWFLLSGVLTVASESISYEKQVGTFEQLILKPIRLIHILLIKSIVWRILNFIRIMIATVIVCFFYQIHINLSWLSLAALVINFFAIVGFSMIFSGLTLKFTKIASFVGIIQYLLLFASGTLISLDKMPIVLVILTKILPINLGLKVSQNPFNLTTFLLLILQIDVILKS
ncbi:ABC transporter permease [Lactococcus cremoris]|uniref:ABC transporter permease n=1 Tax=Lactococcus lactis subsp. cremoris TaxID=1359 RepID=UPI0007B2A35D|nr:ABC transporter permease [Lactococcus cremoris]KZK40274.1 ABC-type multidrug transport system permease component [Lactococcus cremoris]